MPTMASITQTGAAARSSSWLRGRVASWVFATDHKRIGALWLLVAGIASALASILAVLTALQTATADASLLGNGTYESVLTMEETLLEYFVLVPLLIGLAVYLVPLMIGARGIALPNVVTVAFWLAAFGGLAVILAPFGAGDAPRSWWTTVPALAANPTRGAEDGRLIGLFLLGVAVLLTTVALLQTIRSLGTPGMTRSRFPLFVQGVGLYAAACLVLAPLFLLGTAFLLLERANPGSFDWYLNDKGLVHAWGWVFGQGIVTLALVPALAATAEIVATFSRHPLLSRTPISLLLVASALLLASLPSADDIAGKRWASVLALLASVPLTLAALALLAAGARIGGVGRAPVPFALGALVMFVVAGVASAWLALRHDDLAGTTFTTARLGALWCAVALALLGALTYWWPKLFGRLLDARLTTLSVGVAFVSSLLLVGGRAVAGEQGQASHTGITIDDASSAGLVAAIGTLGLVAALGLFALAALRSANGRRAGNDPWQADTLEWYTTSPPPPGNFQTLPPVTSSAPLADLRRSLAGLHGESREKSAR